jgi:cell division protein FtsW
MHPDVAAVVPRARLVRPRELLLLLLAAAVLAVGHLVVWHAYPAAWQQPRTFGGSLARFFLPLVLACVGWIILSVVLGARRCRETLLLPIVALLVGFGLLFLLRLAGGAMTLAAESGNPKHLVLANELWRAYSKQCLSLIVAWGVWLLGIVAIKDYRALARYKYLVAAAAVLLLLLTTILGHSVGKQTIALNLGPLNFQPHDPVKLLLVVFMAAYLAEHRNLLSLANGKFGFIGKLDLRYMGPVVALWLLVMAIIFRHNDLGALVLLFGSLLGMLYIGTPRVTYVAIGLALFVMGGAFAYMHSGTVQQRVAIWQNPWQDVDDKGYQIAQALTAMGNGKTIGAGLAGGFPETIPEVQTDMIYAAISEDIGLVGGAMVVLLFVALIGRMVHVSLRASDRFGQLLAGGLAIAFALQTLVILAGVTKLVPLTGITLPFLSYGGTSLVVNFALLALVLKVAEERS